MPSLRSSLPLLVLLGLTLGACSSNDSAPGAGTGGTAMGGSAAGSSGSSASGGSSGGSGVSGGTAGMTGSSGGGMTATGGTGGSAGEGTAGGGGTAAGGSGGTESGGSGGAAGAAGGGGGGSSFPDPSTFVCNAMLGVSVNDDWFTAGFEDVVGSDKWQLLWRSQAFVEQWADPNNGIWSEPLVSPCTAGSTNPDRVLFTGVNWTYTTAAEWETQLTAVVENIKAKYPAVKEIDLMTMVRAPNNQVCGDPNVSSTREQVTAPFLDEANAAVAAQYPTLVRVAPPFYAPSCDVFQPNSPHFADGGAAAVSKVFSAYYVDH